MNPVDRPPLTPAFLWPVLAAETASEIASAMVRSWNFVPESEIASPPEPCWTTRNEVVLEIAAMRLRAFAPSAEESRTLICAPFALHGATIVDFAPRHSLVAALQEAGLGRIFVTDWRSATAQMRDSTIDDYLAALNVAVDEIGGSVDLIGLCQGGWMALIYAARFPVKVRKLVLAGAPIDIAAGKSKLSELAVNTPIAVFNELVRCGDGRALGQYLLQFWPPPDDNEIQCALGLTDAAADFGAFRRLQARFHDWYAWTVDLPGGYYLQVVEQLFKQNQLAQENFMALGRRIDFSKLGCPLYLLAARDDDVVAAEQLFATEKLVAGNAANINKQLVPGNHLSLFMGRENLTTAWPEIVSWLKA